MKTMKELIEKYEEKNINNSIKPLEEAYTKESWNGAQVFGKAAEAISNVYEELMSAKRGDLDYVIPDNDIKQLERLKKDALNLSGLFDAMSTSILNAKENKK